MTAWQPLHHLPLPHCLKKKTLSAAAGLDRRIDCLLADRATLDADLKAVQSARPDADAATAIRRRLLEVLTAEVELRQQLAAWFDGYHSELAQAAAKAAEELIEAEAKVNEQLDELFGTNTKRRQWMARAHPRIREATAHKNNLKTSADDTAHRDANAASLKATRQEILTVFGRRAAMQATSCR